MLRIEDAGSVRRKFRESSRLYRWGLPQQIFLMVLVFPKRNSLHHLTIVRNLADCPKKTVLIREPGVLSAAVLQSDHVFGLVEFASFLENAGTKNHSNQQLMKQPVC